VDKFDQNRDGFLDVEEVRLIFMCIIKLYIENELKNRNKLIILRESMFSFI